MMMGFFAMLLMGGIALAAPVIDMVIPVPDAYPWEALVTMSGASRGHG